MRKYVIAVILFFTAGAAFNFNVAHYFPWNGGFNTEVWDNVLFIVIALGVGIVVL